MRLQYIPSFGDITPNGSELQNPSVSEQDKDAT